MDIGYIMV